LYCGGDLAGQPVSPMLIEYIPDGVRFYTVADAGPGITVLADKPGAQHSDWARASGNG
jgi:hypothetical protein